MTHFSCFFGFFWNKIPYLLSLVCNNCGSIFNSFLKILLVFFFSFFFHFMFLRYCKKNCCSHQVLNEVLICEYDLRNYSGSLSRTFKSENNREIEILQQNSQAGAFGHKKNIVYLRKSTWFLSGLST